MTRESMAAPTEAMLALMVCWLTEPPGSKKSGMLPPFVQKAPGQVLCRRKKQVASKSVGTKDNSAEGGLVVICRIRSCCGSALKSKTVPCICTEFSVTDCGDCVLLRRDSRLTALDVVDVVSEPPAFAFLTTCWLSSLNMRDSSSLYPGHARWVLVHCEQTGRA